MYNYAVGKNKKKRLCYIKERTKEYRNTLMNWYLNFFHLILFILLVIVLFTGLLLKQVTSCYTPGCHGN